MKPLVLLLMFLTLSGCKLTGWIVQDDITFSSPVSPVYLEPTPMPLAKGFNEASLLDWGFEGARQVESCNADKAEIKFLIDSFISSLNEKRK